MLGAIESTIRSATLGSRDNLSMAARSSSVKPVDANMSPRLVMWLASMSVEKTGKPEEIK